MKRLYTIGYEGASVDAFLATLKRAGVDTLLDVREIPLSRRKGFSKTALRTAIEAAGIEYRHERSLGSPKPIRQRLHDDGDYDRFFESFGLYLKHQQPLLQALATTLRGGVALMCYERDPATCHRSIVARQLELLTGLKTRHLGVMHDAEKSRACIGTGEGVPAA